MPVLHVDAQSEKLQKFESEQQELVNERQRWDESWTKQTCSKLSRGAVKKKLDQLRATPQTDPFLQKVHNGNKDVVSKTAEINKVKQDLELMQLDMNKLATAIKERIARKNGHDEHVGVSSYITAFAY